jgi:hypothetical protein
LLVRWEALWRDGQNPLHAIQAILLCLTWRGADGRLTGLSVGHQIGINGELAPRKRRAADDRQS